MRNSLCWILVFSLAAPGIAPAEKLYPVVVTPGTPSIWSMEQAHYLLGRLRANNDALRTKTPGAEDLDPNATNALRMDALQSRLGVAAELNEIVRAQNKQALSRAKENEARRPELVAKATAARATLTENKKELAKLQGDLERLTALIAIKPATDTSDETVKLKTEQAEVKGKIKTLEGQNALLEKQITELEAQTDLGGLKAVDPVLARPDPAFTKVLAKSVTSLLDKTVASFDRPKLQSSIVLDNYLQMQYEILAKQLTLLRDEIGAGQRVVFLEMPTSISAAGHKIWGDGGEDKLAQSWWKVNRILRRYKTEDSPCFVGEARYERFARANRVDGGPRSSTPGALADEPSLPIIRKAGQKTGDDYLIKLIQHSAAQSAATVRDGLVNDAVSTDEGKRKTADEEVQRLLKLDGGPAAWLYALHVAIREAHNKFLVDIRNISLQSDPVSLSQKADDASKQLLPYRRLLRDARTKFIARIVPSKKAKEYSAVFKELYPLEAPCQDERSRHAAAESTVRDLTDAIKKRLDDPKLDKANREKLEKLRDVAIPGLWDVLDDRIADLLAVHQAAIYEWIGGPELISSAFYSDIEGNASGDEVGKESGQLRAVDLIPRQTALNVNSTHAKERNSALSFAYKALFGFGMKVDYQQQREQYDQFLQQETFASGFGKGQSIFGWTFGPLPGSRVLNSGTRNTYAVLAVPDDASALEIEGLGCSFNYKDRPPTQYPGAVKGEHNCGTQKLHALVGIPDQDNSGGFWLNGIDYAQTDAGKSTTVIVRGSYISPQTTVLVDGRRLQQVLGIGKPLRPMDDGSVDETVEGAFGGSYEYVDSQQMAINLKIPKGYEGGFPAITLVAPSRAAIISDIKLPINGRWGKLSDSSVLPPPPEKTFGMKEAQMLAAINTNRARVQVTGTLLDATEKLYLNGDRCDCLEKINDGLLMAECPISDEPNWQFLAVGTVKDKTKSATQSIANPLLLSISSFEVKTADIKYKDGKKPELVPVDLIGSGFTPRVKTTTADVKVIFKRSTLVYVEISNPGPKATTIKLYDPVTKRESLIDIPTPPDQKAPDAATAPGATTITTTQTEKKVVKK